MLSTSGKDLQKENIFQAERLLLKIENIYLTERCKKKLCELVKIYFYKNYENCSPNYGKYIKKCFKFELTRATALQCTKSDNLEMPELILDISSTFYGIIYKACDSRIPWWEKTFKEIELKINHIGKIKIKK